MPTYLFFCYITSPILNLMQTRDVAICLRKPDGHNCRPGWLVSMS